jgi:hypothetical protein
MCDLREAAENIARMEAAYKATGIPTAPAIRPAADELRPIPDKPSERVENAALVVGVIALLAGFLT